MQEIKLIHTADLHLDSLFEYYDAAKRKRRREEILKKLEEIDVLVEKHSVQGILITGDLFDTPNIPAGTWCRVLVFLEKWSQAGTHVYIVPGNHDPSSCYRRKDLPCNVHFFHEAAWSCREDIPGFLVFGFAYDSACSRRRVLSELSCRKSNCFRVGLLHGSVIEGTPWQESYAPISKEDIANSNLHYLALGHYHNYKEYSAGMTRACYPGSPARMSFNEIGERYVLLVSLTENVVKIRPVAVPDRKYLTLEYDMTGGDIAGLYRELDKLQNQELCLRLKLKGFKPEGGELLCEDLRNRYYDSFYYFQIQETYLELTGLEEEVNTVKGLFLKHLREQLQKKGISEEEKKELWYALRYGLAALQGREIP